MSFALGRKIEKCATSHISFPWTLLLEKGQSEWDFLTFKTLVFSWGKPYQPLHRTQLDLHGIQHEMQSFLQNNSDVRNFYLGVWNSFNLNRNAAYGIRRGRVGFAGRGSLASKCHGQNMQIRWKAWYLVQTRHAPLLANGVRHRQVIHLSLSLLLLTLRWQGSPRRRLRVPWKLSALTDWCKWQSLKCIPQISTALGEEECQYLATELICGSALWASERGPGAEGSMRTWISNQIPCESFCPWLPAGRVFLPSSSRRDASK